LEVILLSENKEGREAAEAILRNLGFTRFWYSDPKKSLPIDLAASDGKVRYLIELKYAERTNQSTSGFPFPWIRRVTSLIEDDRIVQRGYKFLVMVISKNEDGMSCLFLEPPHKKFPSKICESNSHGTKKDLEELKDELNRWD
jgi:hypothetical protein